MSCDSPIIVRNIFILFVQKMSEVSRNQKLSLKVVLLGDKSVGKTSLIKRYVKNEFHEVFSELNTIPTIGTTCDLKYFTFDGQKYEMEIWDTTGEERYQAISRLYYRGADAAVICYDIKDTLSVENLAYWANEMRHIESACKLYICATKLDLLDESYRKVALRLAESHRNEYNAKTYLVSSKKGVNVGRLFKDIIQDNITQPKCVLNNPDTPVKLEQKNHAKPGWCFNS